MSVDSRTPVLVGVAAVQQRVEDPREASEPLDLMAEALEKASEDAGSRALLGAVDSIWSPRGFWAYADPGRLLAERFGATGVRTAVAEIGVLQTTLLGRAAGAIARGESEVAMIVGAEARDRAARFQREGVEVPLTAQPEGTPDEVLRPAAEIMGKLEIERGLVTPVLQYALIDNALRAHEGQSIAAHRAELGALWARMSRIAAGNPDAWHREPMSAEAIREPGPGNRMLAFPYTRWLVSHWDVNQGAGLVLCSLEQARRLGLDASRFVYPLAVVDSEHMVTLGERPELHRSPGFRLAGERAARHLDRPLEALEHLELYSCFPAAVRVQRRELGLDPERDPSQTGGMTFGGGPLNSFVLQGWVRMVQRLREDPGSSGLVTGISGLITKQGVSVLGPEPTRPFLHDDVTAEAEAEHVPVVVEAAARGRARVASYTVGRIGLAERGTALVCDLDAGGRTIRVLDDPELAERAMQEDLCGREVELGDDGLRWL